MFGAVRDIADSLTGYPVTPARGAVCAPRAAALSKVSTVCAALSAPHRIFMCRRPCGFHSERPPGDLPHVYV